VAPNWSTELTCNSKLLLCTLSSKKKKNKKFNYWLVLYDLEVTVKFLLFCLEEFQENLNLLKKGTVGTIYEFCRTEKFNPGSL